MIIVSRARPLVRQWPGSSGCARPRAGPGPIHLAGTKLWHAPHFGSIVFALRWIGQDKAGETRAHTHNAPPGPRGGALFLIRPNNRGADCVSACWPFLIRCDSAAWGSHWTAHKIFMLSCINLVRLLGSTSSTTTMANNTQKLLAKLNFDSVAIVGRAPGSPPVVAPGGGRARCPWAPAATNESRPAESGRAIAQEGPWRASAGNWHRQTRPTPPKRINNQQTGARAPAGWLAWPPLPVAREPLGIGGAQQERARTYIRPGPSGPNDTQRQGQNMTRSADGA